jgi:hypothetical protein
MSQSEQFTKNSILPTTNLVFVYCLFFFWFRGYWCCFPVGPACVQRFFIHRYKKKEKEKIKIKKKETIGAAVLVLRACITLAAVLL